MSISEAFAIVGLETVFPPLIPSMTASSMTAKRERTMTDIVTSSCHWMK